MSTTKTKNIILCADGTGNAGGYTPDSNVYAIYNAIELHDPRKKQFVFYDNGVGTQTNKYLRGIASAFGFGFKRNVKDLYEFLARNYNPGDHIYIFGFSRGAATVRAFNGFVHACGLVDGRGKSNRALKKEVELAYQAYARPKRLEKFKQKIKIHQDTPQIEFLGVWDTVSALGLPVKTDMVGIGLLLFHVIFRLLGDAVNFFFPYKFYNYELTPNIIRACHAVSIDDERTSFWPIIWDESIEDAKNVKVEQVWFAGVHSNVGGGYERAELSNVCLAWMMESIASYSPATGHGLILKPGAREAARDNANVFGRLYDSREGFATYYRYHPRQIKNLCENKTDIKIHRSALRRLEARSANYAPTSLPFAFKIADDKVDSESKPFSLLPDLEAKWKGLRSQMERAISFRKWLYAAFIEITLAFVIYAFYLWVKQPPLIRTEEVTGAKKEIREVLEYFTPQFFDGLIEMGVVRHPWCGLVAIGALLLFLLITIYSRRRTTLNGEDIRTLYITTLKKRREESELKEGA